MKCKQAFMYGPFDLRIEEVELPPLKPDQILKSSRLAAYAALTSSAMRENPLKADMTSLRIPQVTSGRVRRLRSAPL